MAGGSGTRLWPASSSRLPKQFLPAEKGSFFSLALERALAVTGLKGRVIVITGISHIPHVITEAAKLPGAEKKRIIVIGEPVAKNTAAAIACVVKYSQFFASSRKMLVLTSDHIIKPLEVFINDASAAASAAEKNLVVFGIPPLRPETGYGYIETSNQLEKNIFNVKAFHEKPDFPAAKKYAANKKFFWNSGMFAFRCDFMKQQFYTLTPDVFSPFEKLKEPKKEAYTVKQGVRLLNNWQGLKAAFNKVKAISFDYAIVEKCRQTVMASTNFSWIDIGNWEEYSKINSLGDSLVFKSDADNCYIDSDIPVALAGVKDLIVVIRTGKNGKPAVALITQKGHTQKVKDVVELIKNTGRKDLL